MFDGKLCACKLRNRFDIEHLSFKTHKREEKEKGREIYWWFRYILHENSIAQDGKLNDLFQSLWQPQYGVQFIKTSSKFEHNQKLDPKSRAVYFSLFCLVDDDSIYI